MPKPLFGAFLVINTERTQVPVQVRALHTHALGQLADTAADFTLLVQKVIMLELFARFTQRHIVRHGRCIPVGSGSLLVSVSQLDLR